MKYTRRVLSSGQVQGMVAGWSVVGRQSLVVTTANDTDCVAVAELFR